jgi:uncharacterized protein YegP (UPF0339 family)
MLRPKVNIAKNGQVYLTLVAENNHVVMVGELYAESRNILHLLDLLEQGIDFNTVILDPELTELMRTRISTWSEIRKSEEDQPYEPEKHNYVGDGNVCAQCGTANPNVHNYANDL